MIDKEKVRSQGAVASALGIPRKKIRNYLLELARVTLKVKDVLAHKATVAHFAWTAREFEVSVASAVRAILEDSSSRPSSGSYVRWIRRRLRCSPGSGGGCGGMMLGG
ncbi:hypothetical protein [Methanopyrus kandleri]